ncbi:ABC transporter permease subunit [Marinobacterium sp. xm-d-509]|nr:Octopine transport system permease protein OccM [Marinobacterium sp. xm-d-509]
MNWSWDVIWEYFPRLFDGVWLTLELVLYSALTGLAIAVPLALMRASKNRLVSALPWAYIYFFRGTPLLVQIFLIYYGSAQFDLIRNTSLWEIFS